MSQGFCNCNQCQPNSFKTNYNKKNKLSSDFMIYAHEAFNNAQNVEFALVMQSIKKNSKKGIFSINYFECSKLTQEKLKFMNYDVTENCGICTISWKNKI